MTKCIALNIYCAYQEHNKHHFYRKYKAAIKTADTEGADQTSKAPGFCFVFQPPFSLLDSSHQLQGHKLRKITVNRNYQSLKNQENNSKYGVGSQKPAGQLRIRFNSSAKSSCPDSY